MDSKNPIVVIIVAAEVIVGLYYLMSPYQNCLRMSGPDLNRDDRQVCIMRTSW